MKIALFGATGGTGRRFVDMALGSGWTVTALARNPSALEAKQGLTVVKGDLYTYATVKETLEGCDAVVFTAGVNNLKDALPWKKVRIYSEGGGNVIKAMKDLGIARIVSVSSGAVVDDPVAPFVFRFIIRKLVIGMYRDMLRLEQHIANAAGLQWTIVRPPYLVDDTPVKAVRVNNEVMAKGMTAKLSRRELAKFIIKELGTNEWVGRYPVPSY